MLEFKNKGRLKVFRRPVSRFILFKSNRCRCFYTRFSGLKNSLIFHMVFQLINFLILFKQSKTSLNLFFQFSSSGRGFTA
ncbi:hypothetical protein BG910_08520 [Neisseria chenwenguii]|uniref:Uncharacterized protein n=1 Tax=Neisseria chenwenguii TaxID=1853278 RepID=A0A220S3J3_9NEIS|nr:hypothetical protein BG910_08520 [Neisseria chenwenguii]ROV56515.1 hypothetical protein EGS38_03820 [Neisseria chenwenguii]